MKHSFAPNADLGICPPVRRSQNCRWGRQTQPGKSVAINKEQRAYSDPSLSMLFPSDVDCANIQRGAEGGTLDIALDSSSPRVVLPCT